MAAQESWRSYDRFLRDASPDRIAKLLARYELYKRVVNVPGDIIECGVFKGSGLLLWAHLVKIFNPISLRRIVGFDTFAGYPDDTHKESDRRSSRRFSEVAGYDLPGLDSLLASIELLGLGGRVDLVPGDARSTIQDYVVRTPGFRIALLNLDFDTYDATLAALRHLFPRVVSGGIVVLDEYAERGWGESDAIDEYFHGLNISFESFPWANSPTAFVVKTGVG
jgi:hypothetical protein